MDSEGTRKHTLRLVPTLAHIQAYERRFGPINGEKFRQLGAALAAIHGDRRYALNTSREAMRETISIELYEVRDISMLSKHLQHNQISAYKYYAIKQKM